MATTLFIVPLRSLETLHINHLRHPARLCESSTINRGHQFDNKWQSLKVFDTVVEIHIDTKINIK